jgi:hypothetical protein
MATVFIVLVSILLVLFGLAVAFDYRGFAARVAAAIAGPIRKPHPTSDRLWSVLPLSLGLGVPLALLIERLNSTASTIVGGLAIVMYYVAMMRLGWLCTAQAQPDARAVDSKTAIRVTRIGAIALLGGRSL